MLCLRLLGLQILESHRYKELSDENRVRIEVLRAARGDIYDRHGGSLANSIPSFNIVFDRFERSYLRKETAVESTVVALSKILGVDEDSLTGRISSAKSSVYGRVLIKRGALFKEIGAVEERRSELPGVEVEVQPLRHYALGDTTCHLLGYLGEVSRDELERTGPSLGWGALLGRAGLEMEYDEYLRGRDGARLVEVDAFGRRVGLPGDSPGRSPRRGRSLMLTIDLDLQRAAEEALGEWERGAVVVLDLKEGGVLALVSKPSFDPNRFSSGLSRTEWRKLYTDRGKPLLNRSVQAFYPPGSVFKLVTSISALTTGILKEEGGLRPCSGQFPYGGRVFRCWYANGHGALNLRGAIARSCDVFFYQVGLRTGVDRLSKSAKEIGLGAKTGVDLPDEKKGLMPDRSFYDRKFGHGKWAKGILLNLAIGQGEILATPLQLALIAEAVALRGVIIKPHIVRAIEDEDGKLIYTKVERTSVKGVDTHIFDTIARAMEDVVESPYGTGARARVQGVRICGKTGTAQNPFGEDHALFIAFAPCEDPEIAVSVVVENGGHGGSSAAPIAQRIIEQYFVGREVIKKPIVLEQGTNKTH